VGLTAITPSATQDAGHGRDPACGCSGVGGRAPGRCASPPAAASSGAEEVPGRRAGALADRGTRRWWRPGAADPAPGGRPAPPERSALVASPAGACDGAGSAAPPIRRPARAPIAGGRTPSRTTTWNH